DRAGAAALEVQLGDVVAGRGVGGLAPATRGPSGLTWSDGASRFQQRDAGLAPVDADQYLLLQLSVSPFGFTPGARGAARAVEFWPARLGGAGHEMKARRSVGARLAKITRAAPFPYPRSPFELGYRLIVGGRGR